MCHLDLYEDSNVVPWGPFQTRGKAVDNEQRPNNTEHCAVIPGWPQVEIASLAMKEKPVLVPVRNVEDAVAEQDSRCLLLELPIELRLQIYNWLHLATPIHQAHLALYPAPMYSAYFLKAVMPKFELPTPSKGPFPMSLVSDSRHSAESADASRPEAPGLAQLLPASRPLCCVPAALLRCCRQVYEEARDIPFSSNEFVFVNWFSSGLSVASAVLHNLQDWQRRSMRWARLEMQSEDLGTDSQLDKWSELCNFWSASLRGLRLKVAVTDRFFPQSLNTNGFSQQGEHDGNAPSDVRMAANVRRWANGIHKLSLLQQLEVELADKRMSNEERIKWCCDLRALLWEDGQCHVSVICVERRG
jgi:hypothetical protein